MYVAIITSWISYEDYWYWLIIINRVFSWTQMYKQHQNIYINMQVKVMINKTSRIVYKLLYYILQRYSQITFLMCICHQHQSRNQVLVNQCVYSQTYWMLDLKQKKIVLWLQNPDANPWKLVITFGPKKRKRHSKINKQIKRNVFTWITRHPQVFQSPISNECLKVMFDDETEPQIVPKLLFQVSVRELHNRLVSDPNDGGLKDARDEDGNIIISNSTLRLLLPPQLKQMSTRYKVMCGSECCISAKIIHSSLISWCDRYLKNWNIKAKMLKEEGLVKNYITYIQLIKIQWCHMGVIFMPMHLIWQRLQWAHILSMIMQFHTGNVYCGAMLNFHVSIFLTKK